MRGSGFITPTAPESMTRADLDAETGTDLEDLEVAQPLRHQPVGVRHDAERDAGGRERPEARDRAGDDVEPERGVGELAVEMAVHLVVVRPTPSVHAST